MKLRTLFALVLVLATGTTLPAQLGRPYGPGRMQPGYRPPVPGYRPPSTMRPGGLPNDMYRRLGSNAIEVKYCTNCGNVVPIRSTNGQICPHCRVHWGAPVRIPTAGSTLPVQQTPGGTIIYPKNNPLGIVIPNPPRTGAPGGSTASGTASGAKPSDATPGDAADKSTSEDPAATATPAKSTPDDSGPAPRSSTAAPTSAGEKSSDKTPEASTSPAP